MTDKIVLIPTYNEKENIEAIIKKVFSLSEKFNILIIDDGSPDGTANIIKKLQTENENKLFLIERKGKLGLGTAYITGFEWALANNYRYIFEMDADFSHNPEDLVRLYEAIANGDADLAIGSRYSKGVNVVNWPMSRVLLSYFASVYVRIITRMKIKDATAGFVCYKDSVLKKINLDKIKFKGYAFQIEMKFKAWKHGFKLKEVSIIFTERQQGKSKMSKSIIWEAVFGVIRLKLTSIFSKKNKK